LTWAGRAEASKSKTIGYEILGELGRGAMGIVYRAHDRKRGTRVALKALPRLEPAALYRFKQEFRALADVVHPNLVGLYELIGDGEQWFISMELIEGVDFLSYVGSEGAANVSPATLNLVRASPDEAEVRQDRGRPALPVKNLGRLREAVRQLAEGVAALHQAGKLHRDIKPSNILVTPAGRVVLLDFGLAAELDPTGRRWEAEGAVVGTANYMAPEQAADLPLSPASDWYCVGALLYEVLTGSAPFRGSPLEILRAKQQSDPPPPSSLVAGVPEDLDLLCMALLSRQPGQRPSGEEVLQRLGGRAATPVPFPPAPPGSTSGVPFVGRERELVALAQAFGSVSRRKATVMHVRGRSGVGKSALMQRFLDDVAAVSQTVILTGRCYEHESVPYKALDSLVDALSRYLRRIPENDAEALMPRDVHHLARIFPVLRSAAVVANSPQPAVETPDPHELRRRAFAALRELLTSLGERRPLILAIDDLQWGDADSAALLAELLRPPDPPALLLLASYRSEDEQTSPFLRTFLAQTKGTDAGADHQLVEVEPLTAEETRELALRLLGGNNPAAQAQAEAVVRESGGNPFFAAELVRDLQTHSYPAGAPLTGESLSLDGLLARRVARLPAEARTLLEVTAVHGRPLRLSEAWAATLAGADERPALATLCAGRLLRSTGSAGGEEIEPYHDRVRETVVAHLAPSIRTAHHGRLAEVLESGGQAEPEVLAGHFHGAGNQRKAACYYARAAEQAGEALAFERAAKLYRLALDLKPETSTDEGRLRTGLADALANAGRGREAAREYLAATRHVPHADVLDLQHQAAFQFMASGHLDEGLQTFRVVLAAVGLKLPPTPLRALLSLIFLRAQLWLRGLRFRERAVSEISPEELRLIEVTWSASKGLGMIDSIQGSAFQTRNLLLALRAGEPTRIAWALAAEAMYVAIRSPRSRVRAARLQEVAEQIAQRVTHPQAITYVYGSKGMAGYLGEEWERGRSFMDHAVQVLRERCTNVAFDIATFQTFALWSLVQMGDVMELSRRCPGLIEEARQRGNLFARTNYRTYPMFLVHLAADDPEATRREMREALEEWSQRGYHLQHLHVLLGLARVELYAGNAAAAWSLIEKESPLFYGSLLSRIQEFRIQVLQAGAASALAAAREAANPVVLLRAAKRFARRLRREKMPAAEATAGYVQAALAFYGGDRARGRTLLEEAAATFEHLDMHLYAAAVRWRLGQLLGPDEGRALIAAADAWMTAQQIRDPARMAAAFAPPFPGANP
jgi:serine/threonine protein kinase